LAERRLLWKEASPGADIHKVAMLACNKGRLKVPKLGIFWSKPGETGRNQEAYLRISGICRRPKARFPANPRRNTTAPNIMHSLKCKHAKDYKVKVSEMGDGLINALGDTVSFSKP
jgi:hypothetical protein